MLALFGLLLLLATHAHGALVFNDYTSGFNATATAMVGATADTAEYETSTPGSFAFGVSGQGYYALNVPSTIAVTSAGCPSLGGLINGGECRFNASWTNASTAVMTATLNSGLQSLAVSVFFTNNPPKISGANPPKAAVVATLDNYHLAYTIGDEATYRSSADLHVTASQEGLVVDVAGNRTHTNLLTRHTTTSAVRLAAQGARISTKAPYLDAAGLQLTDGTTIRVREDGKLTEGSPRVTLQRYNLTVIL